ncbi:MAG TPA: TonB-dependent receptor [Novosphingobium sp.]|nr:TonB-dependent receptor [Novosphingobium sp.]
MKTTIQKAALRGATSLTAFALLCGTAYAQDTAPQAADEAGDEGVIIVTGSLLRQTDKETASPVTVLSSESLQQRGINTASEAIQRLSANGAGTITGGWNTGSNFAAGANAPSLRGLTVQNTLSIVDGLRLAPYPLADDGQRNFVDLNTIPNAIIERIEVLKDGASSTYGADAIAGVVNIITKKEIQGVHANGSAGISDRGDYGEQRIDLTVGYGDLADQGFNVYLSGEYQKQDALWARDRGYPYNSTDLTGVCNDAGTSCMANHNWNGYTPESGVYNGLFSVPNVSLVRPVATGAATGAGRFSYLNPTAGCLDYPVNTNTTGTTSPLAGVCEVDYQRDYQMLQPDIERYGLTGRATVNLGDRAQFYAMGTYYKTKTYAALTPLGLNGTPAATPGQVQPTAYNVLLPVYVCAQGQGTFDSLNTGCNASNGVLNPNNPYAAAGQRAQILLRSPFARTDETSTRALRGVAGVDGSFGNDWRYGVNFTASEVRLKRTQSNYIIPSRVMDVAATGAFNFVDPTANSQDVWDYIAPTSRNTSVSKLWQVQGTLAKDLMQLPGGPLQAAVGIAYRKESIDSPSANPANDANPFDRYYSINAVGAEGSRNVKSAFFELQAPIIEQLELTASGRYDKYSTGQENFSPKLGIKATPIDEVVLRGTFSKGFRIPSFNEAFGLPTTGYLGNQSINCDVYVDFCAAHANPDGTEGSYTQGTYSIGLTQTGNPSLKPEKSTSFTAGIVVEPIRNVSFSVDFWHIKIKNLITGVTSIQPYVDAYYSNNGVVDLPNTIVVPGTPDDAHPDALPRLGFIQTPYQNAGSQSVSGIDFAINADYDLTSDLKFISQLDASYTLKYKLKTEDGTLRYDGTLSPCNITSCSGAPKWRGTWQNTLVYKDTSVTLTAYYTKGVNTAQIDYGMDPDDCLGNVDLGLISYEDGTPVQCKSKDIWNVDLSINQKINDNLSIYLNALNVFDIKAPVDVNAAYGIYNYNPAFAGPNIIGRYLRVGAKVDF